MKARRSIAVLAALCVTAVACGDDSSSTDDTDAAASTTEGNDTGTPASTPAGGSAGGGDEAGADTCTSSGGDLVFAVRNEPRGLDPYEGGTSGSQGGHERQALFDSIMQYDPEADEYVPRMAESLESNADASEWTLTLRDDVTFGNGEPVDTAAVKFTVNRHRAEDSQSLARPWAAQVKSMEIIDDRTMVFELTGPWGNFASLLAGAAGMVVHPETLEQLGADQFAADPQGGAAGPFRVERYAPGEELVLTARDNYWGGEVCLDTVTFRYGLDDAGRYQAFQNEEFDVAYIRGVEEIAQAEADGVSFYESMTNAGYVVAINHGARGKSAPGEDLRVRQAIAYALDADVIDQRAFDGNGTPDTALVPESSTLYSEGIEGPEYDLERAKQLLEEAKADGYDGSLHFLCNETYEDAAIAITGLLEAAGFDVELDAAMSVQDWAARYVETDYDIACSSVSGRDGRSWSSMAYHYSGVDSAASLNGYESTGMVEALDAVKAATTTEERREAFVGVQKVWNEDVPAAVYGHAREVVIWNDSVSGIEFSQDFIAILDDAEIAG